MATTIAPDIFTHALCALLEETFEKTHGIYLDKDTTLTHSLKHLTAEQASQSVVPGGSTIGAHVFHVIFYLDVLEQYMDGTSAGKVDWPGSWQHKTFASSEWDALRARLVSTYRRLSDRLRSIDDWNDEKRLGGALGSVVHTAYHLGAIRQMLLLVSK